LQSQEIADTIISMAETLLKTGVLEAKNRNLTLCVKENDTTRTANTKIFVLQAWHIFTRTCSLVLIPPWSKHET